MPTLDPQRIRIFPTPNGEKISPQHKYQTIGGTKQQTLCVKPSPQMMPPPSGQDFGDQIYPPPQFLADDQDWPENVGKNTISLTINYKKYQFSCHKFCSLGLKTPQEIKTQ